MQNVKQFDLNCYDNFEDQFHSFQQELHAITQTQQYTLWIYDCLSNIQMNQILCLFIYPHYTKLHLNQPPLSVSCSSNLIKLSINESLLSKESVKNLAKSKWDNLNELWLVNCGLDIQSIKVLAKCEWKQLKELSLSSNQIADDSIEFLSRVNGCQLVYLDLWYNPATQLGTLNLSKQNVKTVSLGFNLRERVAKIMKKIKQFSE